MQRAGLCVRLSSRTSTMMKRYSPRIRRLSTPLICFCNVELDSALVTLINNWCHLYILSYNSRKVKFDCICNYLGSVRSANLWRSNHTCKENESFLHTSKALVHLFDLLSLRL